MSNDLTTVYQYFAAGGQLLYVGVTKRGERRMHEHSDKEWWQLAIGCSLEHYSSRAVALARETELIQKYRPVFNQQDNPERTLPVRDRSGYGRLIQGRTGGSRVETGGAGRPGTHGTIYRTRLKR